VKHRLEPALAKHVVDRLRIGKIALNNDGTLGDRLAMAGRKIIEHHHVAAAREQAGNQMAADKAGPADNKTT
jgi:hypothetical protein